MQIYTTDQEQKKILPTSNKKFRLSSKIIIGNQRNNGYLKKRKRSPYSIP